MVFKNDGAGLVASMLYGSQNVDRMFLSKSDILECYAPIYILSPTE